MRFLLRKKKVYFLLSGPTTKKTFLCVCLPSVTLNFRNSTQFIIDDHENSNLFWNFEAGAPQVNDLGEQEEGGGAPHPAGQLVREHDNER